MKKMAIEQNKSIKRIYIILYDHEEFMGYDRNIPIKAFKVKKSAELYASSRNFEFQTVCMLDEEDYENYVLSNGNSDYVVSISDLRDANGYVREEIIRLERNKTPVNIWKLLENIAPFKVVPVEYINDSK
jgi:hypothetical protein